MKKYFTVLVSLLIIILIYVVYSYFDNGINHNKTKDTAIFDKGSPEVIASSPATPESSGFTYTSGNQTVEYTITPHTTAPVIVYTPVSTPEGVKTPQGSIKIPETTLEEVRIENEADSNEGLVEIEGLVELKQLDNSFIIDLRYATDNNFTGKKIYSQAVCLINKKTAEKLIAANNEFREMGYKIKIFDAYRPFSAQRILWEAAEDKSFVANPNKGSVHNRGAAVDITLVDMDGNEVDMPSGYDEFTNRARIDYMDCTQLQKKNRELLASIMVKHGFKRISNEWWHFDDTNAKSYPILDVSFEEFSGV